MFRRRALQGAQFENEKPHQIDSLVDIKYTESATPGPTFGMMECARCCMYIRKEMYTAN